MAAQKTRMLTAEELVQLRIKVDKTLPIKGTKEFQPSNSWLEKKQIQAALDERKVLLEEERVERLGVLTRAEWDPELKIANVTCRVGRHWKQMGHEVGGRLYLFPEEALFLLETTCLELMHSGVAMSIQEGYSTLLGTDTGCTFNEYQTYVHLVRQGYIVLRHSKSIKATRYERQIRLDQYSVRQKQCKVKENSSVQEIVIEDTKEHVGVIKPFLRTEGMQKDVKVEEQEIIDVETIESVDINDDRTPDKATVRMNEASKRSWSKERSVCRISSSKNEDIKSNPFESKMSVRTDSKEKDIITINEIESGEEAIKVTKNKSSLQEKDSQTQSVAGSNSSCERNCINVDNQNCRSDVKVMASQPDSRPGINEDDVEGGGVSSADLQNQSCGVSSETREREVIFGITAESSGITAVGVETMTGNSLEKSGSGVCCQDGRSSKGTNRAYEVSISHMESIKKRDNYASESVKAIEPTSDEIIDVTDVEDDSSTSMDVRHKEKFSEDKNEIESQLSGHEGDKKQLKNEQNVTQKLEEGDYSDVVEVSDSSQTSHPDLKMESSAAVRRCGNQNKTLTEKNDEIEIVSIVDTRDDADSEIVAVNHSASGRRYISKFCKRKSNQNSVKSSAVQNEVQVSQKNTPAVKPDVVNLESDAVASVTLSSSTQNSKHGHSSRQFSNDTAYFGKGKITNIHLRNDEVEITPSIIDISEERVVQGTSYVNQEEATSTCRSEIEVVDLEDEDMRPDLSWEEERMRILDSIPSIDGKFIIHVRVPDKKLLPPNVCPQKEDYYIQKCRLSAPGIGGKLRAELPNDRAHQWQNGRQLQTDGRINPWIQDPSYNFGGGGKMFGAAGIWNNSAFPTSDLFMNRHDQTPFPGACELQTVFHQAAAVLSVFGNPAWVQCRRYGMPAMAPNPQHSWVPRNQRPCWHYKTRPYYRRSYYKRRRQRFEMHYHSASVTLGKQHFENQTISNNDMIPLKVVDETHERASKIPPKDKGNAPADDDGIIECVSVSPPTKAVKDSDDDGVNECMSVCPPTKAENEPTECTSSEGQKYDSNKNGTDQHNGDGHRKRKKGSMNTRFFEPSKKLKSFTVKHRFETKEDKRNKDILRDEGQDKESKEEVLQQKDTATTDVRSWRDLKPVMQVVVLNSEDEDDIYVALDDTEGSEVEINEPLVRPEDCKDIDSILEKLQIIKSTNFEHKRKAGTNERLKISFDLYLPTATFRKASPGLPNYRITVVGYEDPMPEPKEMVALIKDFQDDVPLLFAVVLPNTVTFLQFGSVKLPVEKFCL